MNKNEKNTEQENQIKTPYEQLIGDNHENEKVDFVWDQVGEELI